MDLSEILLQQSWKIRGVHYF